MVHIDVIAVGRQKEDYLKKGCEEYLKRLTPFCKMDIIEINEEKAPDNPSDSQIETIKNAEGARILAKIPAKAKAIALCIEGKQLSSLELSKHIDMCLLSGGSHIVFIIGGSWGLSDEVKKSSGFLLSVSKMTFPHQLFRLMLLEQIYRAFQISADGKYHK